MRLLLTLAALALSAPIWSADSPAPPAKQAQELSVRAKMKHPASPDAYYPLASKHRNEKGSPVVRVCVGPDGKPIREPEVVESSGFPDLDAAAIKVAMASRYEAGKVNNVSLPESCIKYRIKFGR